ncbi:hypothetical protein BVC93_27495 [Mycobacterium sp. MS1601]|uniref:DUF427 domain-containing protein n=1 Tax=Mycobacterium sp. MS1601 TaxID=1936029 RepID=UPI000979862C|nr:DUF427 domain-containing protein [Mycobacterium sp. MS1601]AQA05497.1 hypothetical protein BVC93_27495 [Mycobacterium sp. MS1601]
MEPITEVRDYPLVPVGRGHIEPVPRRVRGFVAGQVVFDTTNAKYLWENAFYPTYYVPIVDVRRELLIDEDHQQNVQFGPSRLYSLSAGGRIQPSVVRMFDADGGGPAAGLASFEWDAIEWYEEDEPIVGHPRNPYVRIDALRSHRHVTVALDSVLLAETHCPVLLFETGLPTRYYIDRSDLVMEHLQPSDSTSLCPYKGVTTQYWSAQTPAGVQPDVAWAYDYPLPEVAPIARMVGFFNEKLDITVDGVALARPRTHFA